MARAILLCLSVLFAVSGARAEGPDLSPDDRKVADGMEARIRALKAAGQLGDAAAETPKPAAPTGPVRDTDGCLRLKTGESAIVQFSDDDSPTGTAAGYGLSRPSDDTYVVELREEFLRGEGSWPPESDSAFLGRFRDKIAACLKEYAGALRNERAGKSMVLRLSDNPALPRHTITIVKKLDRRTAYATSVTYPEEIPCAIVLHEQLHLLGLPDEYKGLSDLSEPLSDCRASSPGDSVMNDAWDLDAKLGPQFAWGVEMCRCEKTGTACWDLAEKNDGSKCPSGTTSFVHELDPAMNVSANALNSGESFVLNEKKVFTGIAPATHTSALYPAHFRAITEPGCRDVNGSYYGCVINAYRSSKAAGPAGACLPQPEACKWRSHKWLD